MFTSSPEALIQTSDFSDPTVLDVFAFEQIFDTNGLPYTAFSPAEYLPEGPQMVLGYFPTNDPTHRKENHGIVNVTERRNAQEYFGDAMQLLAVIRSSYTLLHRYEEPITNSDALKIAHMGVELPRYLLWYNNTEYRNGEIPPETILLSRALRGFHGLMTTISWGMPPDRQKREEFLQKPFSAEATIDAILTKNALQNDLVCAGHWNMIKEMVEIIGGKASSQGIGTAEVGYVTNDLLDFSKSLRAIWDVVYPGIEEIMRLLQEPDQDIDQITQFATQATTVANMANMLINRVMGRATTRELDIDELAVAFEAYTRYGNKREGELKALIAEFNDTHATQPEAND